MNTKELEEYNTLKQQVATLKQLKIKGKLLINKAKDMIESLNDAQKLLESL